jgi:aspartate-semialdehyde dehydrogenase
MPAQTLSNPAVAIVGATGAVGDGIGIGLFSAGGAASKMFAPTAVKAGAIVIDNSSAFRMDPQVPLVVPEFDSGAIAQHRGIIGAALNAVQIAEKLVN